MQSIGDILSARPRECRHAAAFLARHPTAGGIGAWCDECARWVTKEVLWHSGLWLPADHEKLHGISVTEIPTRPHAIFRLCERCRKWGACEVHHLAPRQFFGDDCEAWPVAYLCRGCHDEWHTRVTPGLCTPYDAANHAVMLFDYLGVARARDLWVALRAEGERRKEAA
jgi:hypothetical protein